MRNILANNKYIVFTNSFLSASDDRLIRLLYLPIIGLEAVNIYKLIREELQIDVLVSKPKNHSKILDLCHIDIEDFITNRKKLEAIGLINSYEQLQNNKLVLYYEVNQPSTPDVFFKTASKNKLLHKTLGHDKYNLLKEKFKVDSFDVSEFNDISAKFDSVFTVNVNEKHHQYLTAHDTFADKKTTHVKFSNSSFDKAVLIEKIKTSRLNNKIFTKEIINFIVDTAITYNISESNIFKFVKLSISNDEIDRSFIVNSCELWVKDTYSREISEEKPESNQLESLTEEEILLVSKRMNCSDFMKYLYNGIQATSRDLKLINETKRDFKLNEEVMNILIYKSLINNDHIIQKAYINYVAAQWGRKAISTSEEALKQASSYEKNNYKKKTTSKKKNKVNFDIPEWVDNDIKKQTPSNEEEKRIKDMMSKWG